MPPSPPSSATLRNPLETGGEVVWCSPRELLTPSRLDIVVKYLYFRALRNGQDIERTRTLYVQHIARRTGGYEHAKRRVDDYLSAAEQLLRSLDRDGFDPSCAVPVGPSGRPHDGAHRIAACLALDRPIALRPTLQDGPSWDHAWFVERGFARDDLDLILRSYATLSESIAAFIYWGAVATHWDRMLDGLRSRAGVVGWADVHHHPDDVPAVVRDVYAFQLGPRNHDRIEEKGRVLARALPAVRVVLADAGSRYSSPPKLTEWATSVKRELRAIGGRDAGDFFTTLHATDSAREARYISELFFNAGWLRTLEYRRGRADRATFIDWLARYREVLERQQIDPEDACIVGSGVLEAVGLRDATDIDCVIRDDVRRARFHPGVVVLGEGVDLVTANYHRRGDNGPTAADWQLVTDPRRHFRFRGLKFANVDVVLDRKRQHRRPKDLADVALWEGRQQPPTAQAFETTCVLFWTTRPIDVVRHAQLTTLALRCRTHGRTLVVGGVPSTPGHLPFACVEAIADVDGLRDEVNADPDPLATLRQLGVDGAELVAIQSTTRGAPQDSTHAFRRLASLAWTARWMSRWLDALAPEVVDIEPADDVITQLLARLVSARSQTPMASTRTLADVQAICRDATTESRLARRASLRHEDSRGRMREVWIWGAGSAGVSALRALRAVGLSPRGFIDRDPAKVGSSIDGLHVHPPAILENPMWRHSRPVVSIASVHAAEIVEMLRSHPGDEPIDYWVVPVESVRTRAQPTTSAMSAS